MENTIDIEAKREQTCIEKLIHDIQHEHISNMLGAETATELCRRIRIAAIVDAENIRRDANFAINKLSEALERMTRQLENKPAVTFDPLIGIGDQPMKISIDDMPKIAPLAECQEGGANV